LRSRSERHCGGSRLSVVRLVANHPDTSMDETARLDWSAEPSRVVTTRAATAAADRPRPAGRNTRLGRACA
jgi:hypothetical protein